MNATRASWIDAFVKHVIREVPRASAERLAPTADGLYTQLGDYDPVEVAEAEWNELPWATQSTQTLNVSQRRPRLLVGAGRLGRIALELSSWASATR